MPFITKELLRKRAEHNEKVIHTLEEISLHQQHLEKIEHLDTWCRHLKILYLQDNLIERMENLSKLKEVEYINLAVNNVSLIENIRGCESLQKLDLTLNFIDVEDFEESCDNLAELPDFREIFLVGNPVTDWEHWKDYIVAKVPTLGRVEGEDVTRSWRLRAVQNLPAMEKSLMVAARASIEKKVLEERNGGPHPDAYSKQWRRRCWEEEVERNEAAEKESKESSMFKDYNEMMEREEQAKNKPIPTHTKEGRVRQTNQGQYEWRYEETKDKTCVVFEIKIPKFLETAQINVDLNPDYVRMDIKGRITQLSHPEFIIVEKSQVQRSTTTGVLQLTMPKEQYTEIQAQNMRIQRRLEQREHERKLRELEKQQEAAREANEKAGGVDEKEFDEKAQQEKLSEMAKESIKQSSKALLDLERTDGGKTIQNKDVFDNEKKAAAEERKRKFYEEFKPDFDLDEVPPLE